ncbi:hypothetical protein Tco_0785526, partial [Tanacetum coccineum]
YNVSKPLLLGGKPGHITIQSDIFFNKDLEYLRYGRKIGIPALSISKMKAAFYPDVGLEQLVPDQFWIEEECKYDVAAMYNYMKKIILYRADLKEYVIAERDFKYMYPSNFEDLYLLNLQETDTGCKDYEVQLRSIISDGTPNNRSLNRWTTESKEIRSQQDKSRDEYKILDEERRCQKQGVHVRYPKTAKDTTYLLKSRKLYWWKDSRK